MQIAKVVQLIWRRSCEDPETESQIALFCNRYNESILTGAIRLYSLKMRNVT